MKHKNNETYWNKIYFKKIVAGPNLVDDQLRLSPLKPIYRRLIENPFSSNRVQSQLVQATEFKAMVVAEAKRWRWENAAAGAIAGFTTVASLHPLDVIRTRFQGLSPLPISV